MTPPSTGSARCPSFLNHTGVLADNQAGEICENTIYGKEADSCVPHSPILTLPKDSDTLIQEKVDTYTHADTCMPSRVWPHSFCFYSPPVRREGFCLWTYE